LGHVLRDGSLPELAAWEVREQDLKGHFGNVLTPTEPGGRFRSLTWRDLRGASQELADELGLLSELWVMTINRPDTSGEITGLTKRINYGEKWCRRDLCGNWLSGVSPAG